jgi:hypothetical protein
VQKHWAWMGKRVWADPRATAFVTCFRLLQASIDVLLSWVFVLHCRGTSQSGFSWRVVGVLHIKDAHCTSVCCISTRFPLSFLCAAVGGCDSALHVFFIAALVHTVPSSILVVAAVHHLPLAACLQD